MNVYQMYVSNGNQAGFFIRRNSWSDDSFFLVKKIGRKSKGVLDGVPPYFENQRVTGDYYFKGQLYDSKAVVSCAGTFGYSLIPNPLL